MYSPLVALLIMACGFLFHELVGGALVNTTIGDNDPLVTYQPADGWAASPCRVCDVSRMVNASRAYGGSWHDATTTSPDDLRNFTIMFTGIAIYLFSIEPNFIPNGISTSSNLSIVLDGDNVGYHVHVPSNSPDVAYDVPFYVNSSLPFGQHSVMVSMAAGSTDDKDHYLLLFNYAIFTQDDTLSQSTPPIVSSSTVSVLSGPPSTPSMTATTGTSSSREHEMTPRTVAGGAVGGACALFAVICLSSWYWRRRYTKSQKRVLDPFTFESPASGSARPTSASPPAVLPPMIMNDGTSLSSNVPVSDSGYQRRVPPPAYGTIRILGSHQTRPPALPAIHRSPSHEALQESMSASSRGRDCDESIHTEVMTKMKPT